MNPESIQILNRFKGQFLESGQLRVSDSEYQMSIEEVTTYLASLQLEERRELALEIKKTIEKAMIFTDNQIRQVKETLETGQKRDRANRNYAKFF